MIASPAFGQSMLGDSVAGHQLAREVCSECHNVEKGEQRRMISKILAFQEIASDPSTTEISLRVVLQSPHIKMPNFMLTPDETDGIVAYILGLK